MLVGTTDLVKLSSVSKRNVEYWQSQGVLRGERIAPGSGHPQRWKPQEAFIARVLFELRRANQGKLPDIGDARDVSDTLRKSWPAVYSHWLCITHTNVEVVHENQLEDLVRRNQYAMSLLDLSPIFNRITSMLHASSSATPPAPRKRSGRRDPRRAEDTNRRSTSP